MLSVQIFNICRRTGRGKKCGTDRNKDILRSGKDMMEGVDIFQIECLAVQMEQQFCSPISASPSLKIMMVIKKKS